MPDIENKEFLRPDEVATRLSIAKRTVYKLIDDPEDPITCFLIGTAHRIKSADLEKWLLNHKKKPWESKKSE